LSIVINSQSTRPQTPTVIKPKWSNHDFWHNLNSSLNKILTQKKISLGHNIAKKLLKVINKSAKGCNTKHPSRFYFVNRTTTFSLLSKINNYIISNQINLQLSALKFKTSNTDMSMTELSGQYNSM